MVESEKRKLVFFNHDERPDSPRLSEDLSDFAMPCRPMREVKTPMIKELRTMIVFVAGMPRSGSTFTFNIVRGLLEPRGRLHQAPVESVLSAVENAGPAEHLIFKGHAADELTVKLVKLGAIKVVCSVRKPEDAIASWMNTFGFSLEESIAAMERWILLYRQVRGNSLVLRYEHIETDPFGTARIIAQYVCPDSDVEEVDTICRSFTKERVQRLCENIEKGGVAIRNVGFSSYDSVTFFHRRHVTCVEEKRAGTRIGSDEMSTIRSALKSHCDAAGYLNQHPF